MQRGYGFRPNQPAVVHQTRCRWIIGDVTEVFDHNTWKLGKIAKIVKNDYFVIRLADCIQLKEFHISSLRVPQPHDAPSPHSKQFPAADNKVSRRGKQLPADALRRSGKKRKSSEVLDFSPQPSQRRLFQVAREDAAAAECSVASCSAANDDAGVSSRHDINCSVGCRSSGSDGGPAGVDVHELKLEAYDGAGAARVGAADLGAGVAAHQPPPLPQHLQRGAPPPAPPPALLLILVSGHRRLDDGLIITHRGDSSPESRQTNTAGCCEIMEAGVPWSSLFFPSAREFCLFVLCSSSSSSSSSFIADVERALRRTSSPSSSPVALGH